LGRVRFSGQARPAIEDAGPALDWSDLESRLGELARFSSEQPSEPASRLRVEPQVTLAHDPHDPLVMLEQLNAQYRVKAADPTTTSPQYPIEPSNRNDRTNAASGPETTTDRNQDPFDILSYFTSIPSKQS
jgi:hypothetical protein